jgi:SAM-dependent methyltransferase
MSDSDKGQVTQSAAEVYEEFFVPALFAEWADRVTDAAHVQPGQCVLDVACGTGVLARAAARRVGQGGSVVGLDINDGMLSVAQRAGPQIEWRQGRAEALPFDDDAFDAVVSQFGLMFFEDKAAAICEMARVLRPGGRLAVAVWDSLERTPGYAAMVRLLERLFGKEAADGLRAPFQLGDERMLRSLFADASLLTADIASYDGAARFPSLQAWMYTDIRGWTLADRIDDAQFQLLVEESQRELHRFVTPEGTVQFASPAYIVTATAP